MTTTIPAIRFKQWLTDWDSYEFDESAHRAKPQPEIYLFSMPAVQLRALSGVYRRRRDGQEGEGLQRLHDEKRSELIRDFIRYGYPYSSINPVLRSDSTNALRKPGWLPTAIVVNIITPDQERRGRRVDDGDLLKVTDEDDSLSRILLPYAEKHTKWSPKALEPLEVIDGQHRLWAFDESIKQGALPGDFELPVVAFKGLDVGWQAYLFWSINVSPKKVNPSHAFDLYPLLRSQDWLETFSELKIYREARAQELTELLYLHPNSPWHKRINMLGESAQTAPADAGVTQAGWVRALMSTFLSPGGRGRAVKGFFGADLDGNGPLDWSRPQQAALLISLWKAIEGSARRGGHTWVGALKREYAAKDRERETNLADPFVGRRTMLNQEQGLRGVLSVANDILYRRAARKRAAFDWEPPESIGTSTTVDDVSLALSELPTTAFSSFVAALGKGLASYDWRSSDAQGLTDNQRLTKRAFRGSGGYVALREQLMLHLSRQEGAVGGVAKECLKQVGG